MAGESLVPDLPLFVDEAERAVRIFKRLRLPDVIGQPTMGEAAGPWVFPIIAAIFGSYDVEAQRRMIQELFLLVPKKNSKSSTAAAIMVVAMIVNRRPEAEFLLIAPTKEIADISFKQARGIIRADPELTKLFHIKDHTKTIVHRKMGAALQIKAADTDTITGSKATGILVDETHVFAKRSHASDVFVEIRGGLAARPDGFMIQITTQSKDPPTGVFRAELQVARDVRDGKIQLPRLAVLYELPQAVAENDGWKDPKTWPLINPNLGRSVDQTFLENQLLVAEREGPEAMRLLASQHFNVQVGLALRSGGWAGANVWDRGADPELVSLDEVIQRSEVMTFGIDGGGLDDLLGAAALGREIATNRWLLWTHAFISPEGMERRKANATKYQEFIAEGSLTLVRELPEDIDALVDVVEQVKDSGLLAQVGVDAAGLGFIVDGLARIGVTEESGYLKGVRQGFGLMDAIKSVERKLADRSFLHGDTALMAWCVGNAKIAPTPTGMRMERGESGYGKIDPLIAALNAAALMGRNPSVVGHVDVQTMVF